MRWDSATDAAAVGLSTSAPTVPAFSLSSTQTPSVSPAIRSSSPIAARWPTAQRRGDAAGAQPHHVRLRRAGDRLDRLERLEHGGDVVVEPPLGVALVRVAPRDREALLAGADEVLEHAPARRHVGDVELVDHRRDEQQRRLAHLRGARLVLDELEQLGPQHHRAGRDREVLADRERLRVDHRRDVRRLRQVVDEVGAALHEVAPAGVERRLQRRRVERREVRRRERVEHVLGAEAHAPLGALVEPRVGDQVVDASCPPRGRPGRAGGTPDSPSRRRP